MRWLSTLVRPRLAKPKRLVVPEDSYKPPEQASFTLVLISGLFAMMGGIYAVDWAMGVDLTIPPLEPQKQ